MRAPAITRDAAEAAFAHHRAGQLLPPDPERVARYAARVFAAAGLPPLPAAIAAYVRGYSGASAWLAQCNETAS